MKYAKRLDYVQEDIIGKILDIASSSNIISFAGGVPDEKLFPIEEIKKSSEKISSKESLQYSLTSGNLTLRAEIAQIMKKKNLDIKTENIIITTGSQQGLDLCGKLFLDEEDIVITESPSYLGAMNAFDAYGAKYIDIEMDENGIILEKLEEAVKNNSNIKFIYVIPDFQNPTGISMSIERRKALVNLANKYDLIIVEDNPYGEINFDNAPLPAIKTFDSEGRVIYLGTMSKIFSPGMRIGYIIAEDEILKNFCKLKEAGDLHSSGFSQEVTAQYLKDNDVWEHIAKINKVYSKRKNLMVAKIKEYFPENIKVTNPNGGLFLWVTLDEKIDTEKLFDEAIKNNVAFVPGIFFYPQKNVKNTMRLNFSACDEENIEIGIKKLGDLIKTY